MQVPNKNWIAECIQWSQGLAVKRVSGLAEAQMAWQPGPKLPSIAFHLWHMARWADRLQARLPAMAASQDSAASAGEELWDGEGFSRRWGWATDELGYGASGMQMPDEAVARLAVPPLSELQDYARRAFAAAERAAFDLDDKHLRRPCLDLYGEEMIVGDVLAGHLAHVNRHLGMIEALCGLQGLSGTATV